MGNAAYHLARLMRDWDVPANGTPADVRGFRDANDLDAWRRHAEAGELIRSIDFTLQGMDASGEDVDMFLGALPRWYSAVHFAQTPWGSRTNATRVAADERDINLLEALGLALKTGKPIELNESDLRSLSDVLGQARELLESEREDLPDDIRRYLHGLICRAEMVIRDFNTYGEHAVRQVAFELGGALLVQAERAEGAGRTENAGRFRAAAVMLMSGFLGGVGGQTSELLSQGLKQLGG